MRKSKIILCSLLIFSIFFFKLSYFGVSPTVSGWFTNACFLLLAALLCKESKVFFDKDYLWINLSLLAFSIISVISVEANVDYIQTLNVQYRDGEYISGVTSSKNVLYTSLGLIMSAIFVEKNADAGNFRTMLRTLLFCMGILLMPVNIDAMKHVVVFDDIEGYMVGNKFTVCYLNLYFCAIYYMAHPILNHKQKQLLLLFIFMLAAVSIHTQCTTTLLGAVVLAVLAIFSSDRMKKHLSSIKIVFFTLFVCDILFFFFTPWFLQFDFVQDFIVNVLHEDLTLTGRLDIYMNIQDAFEESPWIGYGVGNSNMISRMYTGAFDAQNGLADLFIQFGALGCLTFLMIIFLLFRQIKNKYVTVYPIVVFVYAIFAISMVEIPFKHSFVFFLLMLLQKKNDNVGQLKCRTSKP